VAYGVALTLALVLFLAFRGMKGMKFNLPSRMMDSSIPDGFRDRRAHPDRLGRGAGVHPVFHMPGNLSAGGMAKTFGIIFVATALPEEILFRCLIQNWLMQKFGSTTAVLAAASLIFGCAHLNNGRRRFPTGAT